MSDRLIREMLLAEYLKRSSHERRELASEFSNAFCIFGCLGMIAMIAFVIGIIIYAKCH